MLRRKREKGRKEYRYTDTYKFPPSARNSSFIRNVTRFLKLKTWKVPTLAGDV